MNKLNVLGGYVSLGGDVLPAENTLTKSLANMEEAFINADRLRTTYQLQVEALHDAVKDFEDARGRYHTQKAVERLLAIVHEQRKANQQPIQ